MRIQCGYSEEEEEVEEEDAEEEEEAEEEDWGGTEVVQRGYPYSLLSPKEEGKWIKIYV